MKCFKCGNVTNLVNSQAIDTTVKRFRQCPKCGNRFETYEIPEKYIKEATEYLQA